MEKTAEEILIESTSEIGETGLFDRIFRKAFVYELSKMKKGSLKVTDSSGAILVFGNSENQNSIFGGSHIYVKNLSFYRKCVLFGDIGFAESYLDGDWETENIAEVISWFIINVDESPSLSGSQKPSLRLKVLNSFNRILHKRRKNTVTGSRKNIAEHYDLGNEFYSLFLDKSMTYSSAHFGLEKDGLEEAQIRKYEKLCQNLNLKSDHHILEIGCGWGGFSIFAASKYGCKVTGITISQEQFNFATELVAKKGLADLVEIKLCDYRYVSGIYDRIVSIEMLEAVGDKFLETYFAKCNEVLKPNGAMALQVITSPDSRYEEFKSGIDFIQKYIFPGSLLPSIGRMNQAINKTGNLSLFNMEDIGLSYAKTLRLWLEGFDKNLENVRKLNFDEKFIRMWRYYLCYCEAAFKLRNISVVQLVYTRPNNLSL